MWEWELLIGHFHLHLELLSVGMELVSLRRPPCRGSDFFPCFYEGVFFGLLVCLMKLFCLVCSAFKALTVIAWHVLLSVQKYTGTAPADADLIIFAIPVLINLNFALKDPLWGRDISQALGNGVICSWQCSWRGVPNVEGSRQKTYGLV